MREEGLADATGRDFVTGVAEHADAHDGHLEKIPLRLRDATHCPLRNASLTHDAVDPRDHLGAVRKGNRAGVELFEVSEA